MVCHAGGPLHELAGPRRLQHFLYQLLGGVVEQIRARIEPHGGVAQDGAQVSLYVAAQVWPVLPPHPEFGDIALLEP